MPATVFRRSLWHDHVSGRVVCKKGLALCPLRVIMLIVSVEGGLADMFGKPFGVPGRSGPSPTETSVLLGMTFSTFISSLSRSMLDGLAAV